MRLVGGGKIGLLDSELRRSRDSKSILIRVRTSEETWTTGRTYVLPLSRW